MTARIAWLVDTVGRAELIGRSKIPAGTLDHWKFGRRIPSAKGVVDLAHAAGCAVEWLMTGIGVAFPTADPAGNSRARLEQAFREAMTAAEHHANTVAVLAELVGTTAVTESEIARAVKAMEAANHRLRTLAERTERESGRT